MNIDKIVKECPRAWEEALLYIAGGNMHLYSDVSFNGNYIVADTTELIINDGDYTEYSFHYRELFDYFDSVGVYVACYYSVNGLGFKAEYWNEDEYKYTNIHLENDLTRTEAEYEAIPIAFEIRQQQIEGNNEKL